MGWERKNALIIGSGGREDALAWHLEQRSHEAGIVYRAPGNGAPGNNVHITHQGNLIEFARSRNCITIVGPEVPLAAGIVDAFREANLPIIGPTKAAARLEWDKFFGKTFMRANGIPTPNFESFSDPDEAKSYARSRSNIVVKWNWLADGKGVTVCDTGEEAVHAIDWLMSHRRGAEQGESTILIEDRLFGEEATYQVLTDGKTFIPLPTSQDYKRVGSGDKDPMTGGMGAYSPNPFITPELEKRIKERIVHPTIDGMARNGTPFTGFLYFGLMIVQSETSPDAYVLEYNSRLGDPETQAVLPRLDANVDIFPYLEATLNERLDKQCDMDSISQSSVTVVMTARGYPHEGRKLSTGELIRGMDEMNDPDMIIFHSDTRRGKGGRIETARRGRVLSITALGDTLEDAAANAYGKVEEIDAKNMGGPKFHYRTDIAQKAIEMMRRAPREKIRT